MPAGRRKDRAEIAKNMSAIRSTQNKREVELRKVLHARGLRFRLYRSDVLGKPDIVFGRARVCVFVDGDYWHGRFIIEEGEKALAKKIAHLTTESQAYWQQKFQRRIARDREVTSHLKRSGWLVIRVWESDVRRDLKRVADRIERAVRRRVVRLSD